MTSVIVPLLVKPLLQEQGTVGQGFHLEDPERGEVVLVRAEGVDQPVVVVPGDLVVEQEVRELPVQGHVVGPLEDSEVAGRGGNLVEAAVPLRPDLQGLGSVPANEAKLNLVE